MRVARVLAGIAGVAVLVPSISVGCISQADKCERAANCVPPTAGATGTTTGGNDAGTPPSCVPSQAEGAVEDKCGIFVSASVGNDANSGTKGSPVATIGHAILEANGTNRPIYVCNEAFTEVVEAPAGVELYGGLDCASGWTWSEAGRTTLTAASDSVPLKLTSGTAVTRVENFAVTAADATQPGGSSIATIIDNVQAEITRTELTAGAARDGDNGKMPADVPVTGPGGEVGTTACTAPAEVKGGTGGMNMCALGVSQGGTGGKGGITADGGDAADGEDGMPAGNKNKGIGATVAAPSCVIGMPGADGVEGGPGMGGTGLGSISIIGYSGANGEDGATGTPGQGGGGGGGSRSGMFCNGTNDGAGASGGGGGAGGCGGKGGEGGRAGGSSIALIALNSVLTSNQVTLKAGNGGNGGNGAVGHAGASGGPGGAGGASAGNALSKKGCTGGEGGTGGPGGPSGGGRGGHSLGIAYKGKQPAMDAITATVGMPGIGGMGGIGNPEGDGSDGIASADPVEFF
jgi:hypothetical protein